MEPGQYIHIPGYSPVQIIRVFKNRTDAIQEGYTNIENIRANGYEVVSKNMYGTVKLFAAYRI